jgi:hypothetical protein
LADRSKCTLRSLPLHRYALQLYESFYVCIRRYKRLAADQIHVEPHLYNATALLTSSKLRETSENNQKHCHHRVQAEGEDVGRKGNSYIPFNIYPDSLHLSSIIGRFTRKEREVASLLSSQLDKAAMRCFIVVIASWTGHMLSRWRNEEFSSDGLK